MTTDVQTFAKLFPSIAEHCDTADLDALLGAVSEQSVSAGDVLIREGEDSDSLYFVVDGNLRMTMHNGELDMGSLGAGNSFCLLGLVDSGPATATVTAESDSTLLALTQAAFRQLENGHLKLTGNILRIVSDELIGLCRKADRLLFECGTGGGGEHANLMEWAADTYKTLHKQ